MLKIIWMCILLCISGISIGQSNSAKLSFANIDSTSYLEAKLKLSEADKFRSEMFAGITAPIPAGKHIFTRQNILSVSNEREDSPTVKTGFIICDLAGENTISINVNFGGFPGTSFKSKIDLKEKTLDSVLEFFTDDMPLHSLNKPDSLESNLDINIDEINMTLFSDKKVIDGQILYGKLIITTPEFYEYSNKIKTVEKVQYKFETDFRCPIIDVGKMFDPLIKGEK